jgi:hypothetical protein
MCKYDDLCSGLLYGKYKTHGCDFTIMTEWTEIPGLLYHRWCMITDTHRFSLSTLRHVFRSITLTLMSLTISSKQ